MNELDTATAHQLSAALGWMELGNPGEAILELDRIPEKSRKAPPVLEVRWMLCSYEAKWDEALLTARELLAAAPESSESWLHHAYSVRRATGGGNQAAWEALLPALEKFPAEPTIPYNLACYACQMEQLENARTLLQRAFGSGRKKAMREMALSDHDLEPLWGEIKTW